MAEADLEHKQQTLQLATIFDTLKGILFRENKLFLLSYCYLYLILHREFWSFDFLGDRFGIGAIFIENK